jgi:tetraacyldisaccharide 4'-kinase
VAAALHRADAAIILGADRCGAEAALAGALPLLHARLAPRQAEDLRGRAVYAIAGIARPAKFHATLAEIGARLAGHRDFPDHHRFRDSELEPLLAEARRLDALPVTTEKDWVRLSPALRGKIRAVAVALEWADEAAIVELLANPVLSPHPHG